MPKINDLNLNNWKEYQDIITDSLWIIGERDKSGAHRGDYHGNFIPQIPNQLMRRFTKKGDVVLDTFLGSGTTLIECKRLGRNGIGIELLPKIAEMAKQRISQESLFNTKVFTEVLIADSTKKETRQKVDEILKAYGRQNVQLIIMHPPYHDIIKFSDRPDDLSNAKSVKEFLKLFGDVVSNFLDLLERKHYLAVVIGDKYTNSEWVPLGFMTMQEVLNRDGLILKSILVKNMVNNRAKRNQEHLWRYRALVGGFYIFRHEYILLFQKK
ncbi:MAG TPA: DNA methyltransferase [Candidatus Paceibacterota bacterium]|nr:DNA methyltransferase [Candidatus Paceibacterota bacterium]HPP65030.1 DNA methyltransferase [Candidatus Paceibacterota bacterium]